MTMTATGELPAVQAYVKLLLDLDALIAEGKGNSTEADAIREEMDGPWYGMTEQEQNRIRGLAEDLTNLAEGGAKSVAMAPEQTAQWAKEAKVAIGDFSDPDAGLAALRRPYPEGMMPGAIPFLQFRCWERLGDLEVALRFLREAERLDPANAICVLSFLERMGRQDEARGYARRFLDNPDSHPVEVFLAAASILAPTRQMPAAEAKPIIKHLMPALIRAWKNVHTSPAKGDIPDLEGAVAYMLGICFERLGQDQNALEIYTDTLKKYPNHGDLRVARGILLYDVDRAAALKEFEKALNVGTTLMWPYFFLAHQALEQERYHNCWLLCVEGLECQGPDRARAQLYEWLGICQTMLGQSAKMIADSFNQAERLDPDNDRIRSNRSIAEARASSRTKGKPAWKSQVARPMGSIWPVKHGQVNRVQDFLNKEHGHVAVDALVGTVG